VARWNGQTNGDHAFSVAEHCIVVEDCLAQLKPGLSPRWRLAALLHDAPEYVIGDLISPFKAAVGLDYKALENRLLAAIHVRFGLPAELPAELSTLIKRADKAAAYFEATQLAGFSVEEALEFFGSPRGLRPAKLAPLAAREAQQAFLARFNDLLPSKTSS